MMKTTTIETGWHNGYYWSGQYWYTKPHYVGNAKKQQKYIGVGKTQELAKQDLIAQLS